MTLGALVKEYRERNGLSQRDFAKMTGLSAGYISMLENNSNPRTGEPITPSITTIKQIADAIGITIEGLLARLGDDTLVSLEEPTAEDRGELDSRIMNLVHQLPDDLKLSLIDLLQAIVVGASAK